MSANRISVDYVRAASVAVGTTFYDGAGYDNEPSANDVSNSITGSQFPTSIGNLNVSSAVRSNMPPSAPPSPLVRQPSTAIGDKDGDDDDDNSALWLLLLLLLLVIPLLFVLYVKCRFGAKAGLYLRWRTSHSNPYIRCFYMPMERRQELYTQLFHSKRDSPIEGVAADEQPKATAEDDEEPAPLESPLDEKHPDETVKTEAPTLKQHGSLTDLDSNMSGGSDGHAPSGAEAPGPSGSEGHAPSGADAPSASGADAPSGSEAGAAPSGSDVGNAPSGSESGGAPSGASSAKGGKRPFVARC